MLNNIELNQHKINNGVWMPLLASSFLIASVENKRFKEKIFDHGQIKLTDDEMCEIIAETILLDWKDVKDPTGADLPYDKSVAVIALKTCEPLKALVDTVSTNLGNYCE